jgi:two-component system CheB/CheR fusion protein
MTRKQKDRPKPQDQPTPDAPPSAPEREAAAPQNVGKPFSVVGIGASAGGLEALELFLQHVPAESGMAFVIVQHLDPTHKAMLPELLQRVTSMKVAQVVDRTRLRPNCVYVIPPNADMSILHGVLHLLEPRAPRGLRLPIDFFFRALAEDLQGRSVGVVLSGMGSDGTLGLRAIREKAGVAFVQEPSSAKFDGMPRSAVDAGVADVVAPVEALPGKIIDYLRHVPGLVHPRPTLGANDQSGLEKVAILLRVKTGHDFSLYKKSTLYRRIERRMGLHQIGKIAQYVRYLQENPAELELLFKELLIGVTSFFRDPPAWEKLKAEVLPALLAERSPDRPLRAWIPACSTGEEAYSLAIAFKEAIEQLKPAANFTLQIFATDLDSDAIERARAGVFPLNIAADLSPERLVRYFAQTEHGYTVGKPIREMVIFAPQNVIMDPPFPRIDILSCRNLLIYMTPELQKKILPLFHYSLNPGGILFLGSAETIGGFGDLFEPLDAKSRLYRRRDGVPRSEAVEFPSAFLSARQGAPAAPATYQPAPNLQVLADHLLLQTYAPAAVLVNDRGDIIYINGRTGNYLEPAAGKANWNIFAMVREGLRYDLNVAFRKALRQKEAFVSRGLNVDGHYVDLTVQTVLEPEALQGLVMVVLAQAEAPGALPAAATVRGPTDSPLITQMERELEEARHEAQCIRGEMQASQEELKSSNEEMQSMNEELQTLNHELQAKLEDLSRLNSDMRNLLESTEITTLFLDDALRVRLFTAGAKMLFKLIPGDVGRPITDITSELHYPELADHALEVLRTLAFHEQQVPTRGVQWYQVRIMPYRTLENRINGVVITFTDVTASKMLEAQLRTTQAGLEDHIAVEAALKSKAEARQAKPAAKESKTPARPGEGQP